MTFKEKLLCAKVVWNKMSKEDRVLLRDSFLSTGISSAIILYNLWNNKAPKPNDVTGAWKHIKTFTCCVKKVSDDYEVELQQYISAQKQMNPLLPVSMAFAPSPKLTYSPNFHSSQIVSFNGRVENSTDDFSLDTDLAQALLDVVNS